MVRRLEIHSTSPDHGERAAGIKDTLRRHFGVYGVKLASIYDAPEEGVFLWDGERHTPASDTDLADYITETQRLEAPDQSCREDAALLDRYFDDQGRLDIYRNPLDWVSSNPMIAALIEKDPRINNVLAFLCEQRGLFLKPPQYRLQGNYWNSPSNGGLPIVRKKDPIHEGTFMLHDLYHLLIQDPLPYDTTQATHGRANFLHHRMASEATTMVMADMQGVHVAELREQGYDTSKRRIYPVFEAILEHAPSATITDVLSANIDFCLTGSTRAYEVLGVPPEVLATFCEKYDTFFSADYDWNAHNFDAVAQTVERDAAQHEYFQLARELYGLPMIDDLYGEMEAKDVILERFADQIQEAYSYTPHNDEVSRMKEVAKRYFGGQLALFYQDTFRQYRDSPLFEIYLSTSRLLLEAASPEAIREYTEALNDIISTLLDQQRTAGAIDSQQYELYRMHVPLYPAYFINYQQEQGQIIPLRERISGMQL